MARQYSDLYPDLVSFENLYEAARRAAKGKRGKEEVATFELELEHHLVSLQNGLDTETYEPGPYTSFFIRDPKTSPMQ